MGHLNVLQEFLTHHNAGSIDRAVECLHPEIRYEVEGFWRKVGKEEVRELMAWNAVVKCRLMVRDCRLDDDSVRCKMFESSDWLSELGIERVEYSRGEFEFRGGLICNVNAVLSRDSVEIMNEEMIPVIEWAAKTRPHSLDDLIADNEFSYSEENAGKWLQLIRDWKAETF